MIISWYGEGCFKIQNGNKVILTDLPPKESGISTPRVKADILIKTITSWPRKEEKFDGFVIYGAGEYDIEGIKIQGFELVNESDKSFFKTVYVVDWDGITIGLLGVISGSLDPKVAENFEEIDVLIAPAGGDPFISQKNLVNLVKQLNPKIFIPSFYKISKLKRKAQDLSAVEKEFNGAVAKEEEKFVFNKKDLGEIKKTKLIKLKA